MTATRAFDLIDTAVAALIATDGLCAPDDVVGGIPVFDGPVVTDSQPDDYIIIGASGFGDEDAQNATTIDAEWMSVPIGAGSRYENVSVPCAVVCWDGAGSWSDLRTRMQTALDLLTDTLLDRDTWDDVDGVVGIVLTNVSLEPLATTDGSLLSLTFTIDARFIV